MLGEFDRVAEQVAQHLSQVVHVALHLGGNVLVDHAGELDVLRLCLWCHQCQHILEPLAWIEGGHLQLFLVFLDLGKSEDVVDQAEQHVGARARGAHVLVLLVAELHLGDEVEHPDDAIQRRTQLVAHGAGEFVLCLGELDGAAQRLVERHALFEGTVARLGYRLAAALQHFHHGIEGALHRHDLAGSRERGAFVARAVLGPAHDRGKLADRHGEPRGDCQQHQQHQPRQQHSHRQARTYDLPAHAGQRLARHHQSHASEQLARAAAARVRERRAALGRARPDRRLEGPGVGVGAGQRGRGGRADEVFLSGCSRARVDPLAIGIQQFDRNHIREGKKSRGGLGSRFGVAVEEGERGLCGE